MQARTQTQIEARTMLRGSSPNHHDPNRLTASNLELHDHLVQLEQQQSFSIRSTTVPIPWSEKIIKDEQIHHFHSALLVQQQTTGIGLNPLVARPENDRKIYPHSTLSSDDVLRDIEHAVLEQYSNTTPTQDDKVLGITKLFEPSQERHGVCRESPLERFLAPGELDGPTYYTRPALEHLGVQAGNLEGTQERRELARMNMNVVTRNKEQALGVGRPVGQSTKAETGL